MDVVEQEKIEKLKTSALELIRRMGYPDSSAQYSEERQRLSLFINDMTGKPLRVREELRGSLEHIIRQMARTIGLLSVYVDINSYYASRENLIKELAKAAAKKVNVTGSSVTLPPMNAYERRLVHAELSLHPDIQTQSEGEGDGRRVVVMPFQ